VVAFSRIDFSVNDFMKKIVDLNDQLMDDETRRTVDEMKETFGFSPIEKQFLLNIQSLAVVIFEVDPEGKDAVAGIVVDLKDPDLFRTYLAKVKENLTTKGKKDYKITENSEEKFPMVIYEKVGSEPEKLYTAFFDNLFAIGIGDKSGLAVLKKLQNSAAENAFQITDNKQYKRLVKKFPMNSIIWTYISGKYVADEALAQNPTIPVDFIESCGLALDYNQGKLSFDGAVVVKKETKNPIQQYLEESPVAPESKKLLSKSTILYLVSRFVFPKDIMGKPELVDITAGFNALLGLDFKKDIYPWLGNEYFLSVNDYKINLVPPILAPGIHIGLKVSDVKAAKNAMEKVEAKYKLKDPKTEYKTGKAGDLAYRYYPMPGAMFKDFILGYTFAGDYLVLTSSSSALETMDKVMKGKTPSLETEPRFKEMLGAYGDNTVFSGFINGDLLTRLTIQFLEAQNTPEAEMKDIRNISALTGFGFGVSNDADGLYFKGALGVDVELIRKMAKEPIED
jgi:hypothetical protein